MTGQVKVSVQKAKSEADLVQAISARHEGLHVVIVEVPTRNENALELSELYQRVAKAVRIGINLA